MKRQQQLLLKFYEQLVMEFTTLPPTGRRELESYEQSGEFTRTSDWRGWPKKRPPTSATPEIKRIAR